jgi:hypothetical protein
VRELPSIHAEHDAVLATAAQPGEVCYACHKVQRAEFDKPSVHPVRFAQMHRSPATRFMARWQRNLIKPTLNETCYSCHAEKRGPVLGARAGHRELRQLPQRLHGSINPTLLVKRPPLLCQQCYSQAGHRSVARTGAGPPNEIRRPSCSVLLPELSFPGPRLQRPVGCEADR